MPSTFVQPIDNFAAVLTAPYAAGDPTIALLWDASVTTPAALAAGRIYRLTAWAGYRTDQPAVLTVLDLDGMTSTGAVSADFDVAGVSPGYADRDLPAGTVLSCEMTAQDYEDHSTALDALAPYVHAQPVAASTWTIAHGRGRYPAVAVVDSAGDLVHGAVRYDSADQVTVTFSAPFAGNAYLN